MTGCRHPVSGKFDALERTDLGRRQVGQRFPHRQAAGSGKVQQGNRRTFADRHRFTVVTVQAGGGNRAVGYRDLPWPDHLIACHHAGHGTVADGDQEGFLGNCRQVQNAFYRIGQSNVVALYRLAFSLQTSHVARHLRRFAQQHVQRHVDRLVVEMAVVQRQMLFFGGFTDHCIRGTLTAANLVELRHLRRGNRHHIAFL
ncbi:hypothetical protein D3C72_1738400 [compost metagenome]